MQLREMFAAPLVLRIRAEEFSLAPSSFADSSRAVPRAALLVFYFSLCFLGVFSRFGGVWVRAVGERERQREEGKEGSSAPGVKSALGRRGASVSRVHFGPGLAVSGPCVRQEKKSRGVSCGAFTIKSTCCSGLTGLTRRPHSPGPRRRLASMFYEQLWPDLTCHTLTAHPHCSLLSFIQQYPLFTLYTRVISSLCYF